MRQCPGSHCPRDTLRQVDSQDRRILHRSRTAHFLRGVPHRTAGVLTPIRQHSCKRTHIIQNPEPFQGHADSKMVPDFCFIFLLRVSLFSIDLVPYIRIQCAARRCSLLFVHPVSPALCIRVYHGGWTASTKSCAILMAELMFVPVCDRILVITLSWRKSR